MKVMVSCPMFRISGSVIKPSRETLLDYSSYCLIVIALIATARIWIGEAGLTEDCSDGVPDISNGTESLHQTGYVSGDTTTLDVTSQTDNSSLGMKISSEEKDIKCAKYYQSVFAYILLLESGILLFSGLIWTKLPRVSQSIDQFDEVRKACGKSNWAKKALNVIGDRGQNGDVSQSLYSIVSSESTTHNIRSFLDQLFHADNDYKSKANARHLYEKVVIFSEQYSQTTTLWETYIMKSLVQFFLWLIICNINLVLFVVLEFYIVCPAEAEAKPEDCKHDTFLRVIWFMGETVLVIYALLNCKTLMWINNKSVIKRNFCCSCRCFSKYRLSYADDQNEQRMICKPYRFADNPPVYNDAALMLHLLEEAHPKWIPPFVVFMFPEWKEKLTSFTSPVLMSDASSSTMQMISGKSPVTIQITDMAMPNDLQKKRPSRTRKKNHVTFTITDKMSTKCDESLLAKSDNESSHENIRIGNSESQPPPANLQLVEVEAYNTEDNADLLHRSSSSDNVDCNLSRHESSSQESDASETGLLIIKGNE